jgi:hypothetical protein
MATAKVKRHDTAIEFNATLEKDGSPVDLTGATSVRFHMKKGATVYEADATVVTPASGTVKFTVFGATPAFPTTLGTWDQEWQVVFADGSKLSFPSGTNNAVEIVADLNDA